MDRMACTTWFIIRYYMFGSIFSSHLLIIKPDLQRLFNSEFKKHRKTLSSCFWKNLCMLSVMLFPLKGHKRGNGYCIIVFHLTCTSLCWNSSASSRLLQSCWWSPVPQPRAGASGWQQASLECSHSHAIRAFQLNSCTTVEKMAIVAGSRQRWEEGSNILRRAKTTAMARCELAQVILFPGHAFPLSCESSVQWLCFVWMIFSNLN